jgi:glycerol-3-phosphate acyltransferase PlsY
MQKQGINDEIKSFYWIGREMSKVDIRQLFSQNIGETFITNS